MAADPARRSARFLIAYALAHAGGVIAYQPLLTLLMPLKVAGVAGDARFGVLTAAAIGGAVAASLANILFGWLSDRVVARGGGRRRAIAWGFAATVVGYAGLFAADTGTEIVIAICLWQVALNAMLAPLVALMADEVPDAQKGVVGGLLTLANPLASLGSSLLLGLALLGEGGRYAVLCLAILALLGPLLALPARPLGEAARVRDTGTLLADLGLAWIARLVIQIGGNILFVYLLFYFQTVTAPMSADALAQAVGQVMAVAYALPIPIAVLVGRLSDRAGARKPFLVGASVVAAAGLLLMAAAASWTPAVVGFGLYACGSAVFLGLHSAYAMQMLPSARHRGRDLGIINLANTLPALIGPALAWMLATEDAFRPVLLVLAGITLASGLIMIPIRARA